MPSRTAARPISLPASPSSVRDASTRRIALTTAIATSGSRAARLYSAPCGFTYESFARSAPHTSRRARIWYSTWSEISFGRKAELSPAEAGNVRIRWVRSDRHASGFRSHHGVPHGGGVTGMEAARYVRRRHEVEQRFVLRETGAAEAFAQVGVQIYCQGQGATSCGPFSRRSPALLRRFPSLPGRPRSPRA